jgi:hypothetical protein
MIELFFIFLSTFIYFIIFSYPINIFNSSGIIKINKLTVFDCILLNILIHLNFFLFFSFFKLNLHYIFLVDLVLAFFFIIYYLKSYYYFLKKKIKNLIFFFIILFSLSVVIAHNPILTWDGVAHWYLKARNFYQDGSYKDLYALPYNYYPHLGPYVWSYFWKNSFLDLEYFGRFFFVFIFVVSIFSACDQLNSKFSNLQKNILTFVLVYLTTDIFLLGGYQEYLLFFIFYTFVRFYKLSSFLIDNERNVFLFLMLLTSNLILWTKQEGFFYYFILNFILFFHYKNNIFKNKIYIFLFFFLLGIFICIKIQFLGSLKFNESIVNDKLINNLDIIILFSKILLISKYILISFFKYPIWIAIIISSVILFYKSKFFSINKFLISFFILSISLIFAIYLQTTMDLIWILPLTLSRLIFPLSGFFIFIIIEMLNKKKINY